MKRSPLNTKPIICAPSEAAILMGKAIREYLKNKAKDGKYTSNQRRSGRRRLQRAS